MLASHHELPSRARVQLRIRTLHARMWPRAERGEEEVSQPLYLLARPAQPDQKRAGSGGLQLRPRSGVHEHQTGHRALPAQDYQHGLHGGAAPMRERRAVQLRYARLSEALRETFQRGDLHERLPECDREYA